MKRSGNALYISRFRRWITRRPWTLPTMIGLVILAVLALMLVFSTVGKPVSVTKGEAQPSKQSVLEAWKSQDLQKTRDLSQSSLLFKPLDAFFLSFEGIASYYLSSGKPEGEERQTLLDEAVFSIRKALATQENIPVKAQVEYVLGKAYYHKGAPWYDLAVKYLELSKADGYLGKDTKQYLGLAYVGMGMHEKAITNFQEALKSGQNDLLMLSTAVSYKELGDDIKAKELLDKAINTASDAVVTQKARYMLAEMTYQKGDVEGAKKLYFAITEADPTSADAWYWLGLIYEAEKDPIKARAAWRKATAINPNHIEARKKLAERL